MCSEWTLVTFAHDCEPCDCCGEPWCDKHNKHYGDCDCIGPTEFEAAYKTVGGKLYGKRVDLT